MPTTKTYFMAWESNDKQGHCIHDFAEHELPRIILRKMIEFVETDMPDVKGQVRANQFNRVE